MDEELAELRAEIAAGETDRMADELGDLLFTLVNVGRQLKIDPEDALRRMTARFAARFRHIEAHAEATGRAVQDLPLDEMEAVWQAAEEGKNRRLKPHTFLLARALPLRLTDAPLSADRMQGRRR